MFKFHPKIVNIGRNDFYQKQIKFPLCVCHSPYCLTSTQMESGEVMLESGDLMAAQVFHMLKKRKTGMAVKPKMARKARARM